MSDIDSVSHEVENLNGTELVSDLGNATINYSIHYSIHYTTKGWPLHAN